MGSIKAFWKDSEERGGARDRDPDVMHTEETGEVVSGLSQLKTEKQEKEPSRPLQEGMCGGRTRSTPQSETERGPGQQNPSNTDTEEVRMVKGVNTAQRI